MREILLPVSIMLFIACNSRPETSPATNPDIDSALAVKTKIPGEPDATKMLIGVYEGVLPCADCEGIKTELTLFQDVANAENNSYILKETYLGVNTGDTTFISKGKWDILKGIKTDQEASVFFLNYDKPDASKYYLKEDESTIVMLDEEQNRIQSASDYTLKKK